MGGAAAMTDDFNERIRRDLEDLGRVRMPFGKYGPDHYPPEGLLLWELPLEYLAWFARKGAFPKGRLGHLMQMVHQMKVEGSDVILRERLGRGSHRRRSDG
jgi:uncharacterized protein (DUF3820 family)